ncbi:MAG TPA: PIN domain-containing protein [Thermoanaerobaculia bacterium]|nr:PIN domain-containing protein [Thermoanaerobaculia bacterium]HXO29690.1 PIN domain-containing protein [Thermoanaerobaculia bacterium]
MILVDTSIWVEVFRKPSRVQLEDVGDLKEIVTCLPVVQEVLQGFREEWAYRVARKSLLALPIAEAPLRIEVFLEAAELFRSARRAGLTVRSGVDCLIAACALRNGLTVAHCDRDFDLLARVSPLAVRSIAR